MLPPNFGVTNFWLAPNREQVLLSNRDKDKSPTVDCGSTNVALKKRPEVDGVVRVVSNFQVAGKASTAAADLIDSSGPGASV
jgi:hypothetical protein